MVEPCLFISATDPIAPGLLSSIATDAWPARISQGKIFHANQTTQKVIIGRCISDVAIFIQFLYVFLISCPTIYFCPSHNIIPNNRERIFKIIFGPALDQHQIKRDIARRPVAFCIF